MNDTHGQQGEGWIGFDLDGTLAKYDGWKGFDHIGDPIGPMVALLRKLHAEGTKVKILTARVAPKDRQEVRPNPYIENHWCITSPDDMPWALEDKWTPREYIQDWCWRVFGFVPEITHEKDCFMLDLYDDRCHQVVPNTGETVEGQRDAARREYDKLRVLTSELADADGSLRQSERLFCAFVGACIAVLIVVVAQAVFVATRPGRAEAEMKLKAALSEYIEARDSRLLLPWGPDRKEDRE